MSSGKEKHYVFGGVMALLLIMRLKVWFIGWRCLGSQQWKISFQEKESMPKLFWIGKVGSEQRNIGDHAITLATRKYLTKNFSEYKLVELSRMQAHSFFLFKVSLEDLIFFNGNGDFGDIDKRWFTFLKQVISLYPRNCIVQLPVSVYYSDRTEFFRDQTFFYDKTNFILCCRTSRDLEIIKSFGCKKLVLPDLVFSLEAPIFQGERKGVLWSMRNDRESLCRAQVPKPLRLFGIQKILTFLLRLDFKRKNPHYHDYNILSYDITDENREESVAKMLKFYSRFELVYSDRYHVWVFCYLVGTPFIPFDGKIKKGCDVDPQQDYKNYFKHNIFLAV